MEKRVFVIILCAVLTLCIAGSSDAQTGKNSRRPAIENGADRVIELQRTDVGWEGTWYWYVGNMYNATNLTGVTALGLLEAFRDVKDSAYLDAAINAAGFIIAHLGAGATGDQYHVRTTAPDIIFLHLLGQTAGESDYATRANLEWANITSAYPTAGDLDALFKSINRRSAWDIAFFLEAAHLSGDTTWADQAATILANTLDTFYYSTDTWWYALNLSGAIRALVGCGFYVQYNTQVLYFLSELISLCDNEIGVGGYIQDTAYAVMAFNSIGGAARSFANDLGRWLASHQEENGGWLEAGNEYPEIDGEAIRALATTIGSNITIDGFEPGKVISSSWRKLYSGNPARPFVW